MQFWCGWQTFSERCSNSWSLSFEPPNLGIYMWSDQLCVESCWRRCGRRLKTVRTWSIHKLEWSSSSSTSSSRRIYLYLLGCWAVDIICSSFRMIGFIGPVAMSELVLGVIQDPWVKSLIPSLRLRSHFRKSLTNSHRISSSFENVSATPFTVAQLLFNVKGHFELHQYFWHPALLPRFNYVFRQLTQFFEQLHCRGCSYCVRGVVSVVKLKIFHRRMKNQLVMITK